MESRDLGMNISLTKEFEHYVLRFLHGAHDIRGMIELDN
jgi:hypothetical protein